MSLIDNENKIKELQAKRAMTQDQKGQAPSSLL